MQMAMKYAADGPRIVMIVILLSVEVSVKPIVALF